MVVKKKALKQTAPAKKIPAKKVTVGALPVSLLKNREISWLSFNDRVLQEAIDPNVPLLEKLKFLSIFSSNLDEFFRVRVASLRRLIEYQRKNKLKGMAESQHLMNTIQQIVVDQQDKFNQTYEIIKDELAKQKVFIIDESQLNNQQKLELKQYFKAQILSTLFPIILDHLRDFPFLRDKSIYLAVKMSRKDGGMRHKYALIEIPTDIIGRFYVLNKTDENTYVILMDDVIRNSLDEIFSSFEFDAFEAYTVKLTRDAELDIDADSVIAEPLIEKITKSLKQRHRGAPVRFIFDREIPEDMLQFIMKKLRLPAHSLIPGGRYHNFKDFGKFPAVGLEKFKYQTFEPIPIARIDKSKMIFDAIAAGDILLHHPYHSFDNLIRLLREAAIDPGVHAIKITLYRVARHSNIVNALINAVKNGKDVTAVIELQARFDEESNLYWTQRLQEEGAKVVFIKPTHKIHAKVCLIYRKENNRTVHYAHFSTGNYNGVTSRLYCDMGLLTADKRLTSEAIKVFSFINNFPRISYKFKYLLVAPFYMKNEFLRLIDNEMRNAKKGKPAWIFAKMNSLVDEVVIEKLYAAAKEGVKIRMVVRGICCLKPNLPALKGNIEIISIIDKFLEHTRCYVFCNDGAEKYYLSSADWMGRNLDRRIEVAFPILDPKIQKTIKDILEIQWKDNVKARMIDGDADNSFRTFSLPVIRSQEEIYTYLLGKGE
jgi:polyphosphate kinase